MLYISRVYGKDKFGVTDTDDGVETICGRSEIYEAVVRNGLTIEGVVADTRVRHISIYQNPNMVKAGQIKLRTLYGVDIKLSGDTIVGISIPEKLSKPVVKVRLSSFGSEVGDSILRECFVTGFETLILIFDDKIKFHAGSFNNIEKSGVRADIVECTKVGKVYKRKIFSGVMGLGIVDTFIIDKQERKDFYRCLDYIHNADSFAYSGDTTLREIISTPYGEICQQVEYAMAGVFETVFKFQDKLRPVYHIQCESRSFSVDRKIRELDIVYFEGTETYEKVKKCQASWTKFILGVSLIHVKNVRCFTNYIRHFEPSESFKQRVIELVKSILDLSRSCAEVG